jgi:hypothetical protein
LLTLNLTKAYHSLIFVNLQFVQVGNTPSNRLPKLLEKAMDYECPYLAGNLSSLSETKEFLTVREDTSAAYPKKSYRNLVSSNFIQE